MRKAKQYLIFLGLLLFAVILAGCPEKEDQSHEEPGEEEQEEEVTPEESPTQEEEISEEPVESESPDDPSDNGAEDISSDDSSTDLTTAGTEPPTGTDTMTDTTGDTTAGSFSDTTTTTTTSSSDTTSGSSDDSTTDTTTGSTTGDSSSSTDSTTGDTTDGTTTSDSTTGGTTTEETTTTTSTTSSTTGSTSGTSEESCTPANLFSGASSEIGSSLPSAYEPSGAVWHERLESYLVVSDTGKVSRLNADGTVVQTWSVSGDLEGVTVADPDTDFIYLGVERSSLSIKEFDISTGSVTRTFNLSTWMVPSTANQGLEALTFALNSSSTEGGYFYAGLQENGKIYVFELPIQSSSTSTKVTYIQTITPAVGYTDIAGLEYHEFSNTLYALYDGANAVVSMSLDGTTSQTWSAPHDDQEGLAFDSQCNILLTLDTGVDNGEVWFFDE